MAVPGWRWPKEIGAAKDKHNDISLGPGNVLHFLMDDGGLGESTPGQVARLRIWDNALSQRKIRHLGK